MASRSAVDTKNDRKNSKIITQYAESAVDFSSQYGGDTSVSYSAVNLVGKPNIYPGYGDFTLAFVLRTYGPWWETSPCAPKLFKEQIHHKYPSQDFVELKFEHMVYPLKIDVFETFNPGAVIKILACDTTTFRWETLWSGEPQPALHTTAQIASPPLRTIDFATDLIRIEFYHRHLEYYAELDAVMLTGTTEPPFQPLIPVTALSACSYPPDQAGLNAICNRLETLSVTIRPSITLPFCHLANATFSSCKDQINYFELLPTEVIQLIVSNLDLLSLCQAACTCRLLRRQCYDSLLYTEVDLQPYWHKVTNDSLRGLQYRCSNLQRLNLSWCGNYGKLTSTAVINFLIECGTQMNCIRLANCKFVVNEVLKVLADVAPDLEELDLRSCQHAQLNQLGFRQICRLTKLKRLNLYRTHIDTPSLLLILRCCPLLEVLNLGACVMISNFDEVTLELSHCCRNLKGLDLWRAKTLTAVGVRAIADSCRLLEEIDLGWCSDVSSGTGCILELVQKCRNLKKLFLTALRTLCDNDILAIAKFCPNLEQLDILGTREVSTLSLTRLLASCPNLKFLDLSFCGQVDFITVRHWQQAFPHISIKKSYQN